ncbi:MAG: Hsp20/alpha crystallin family protein [Gemmataceae bacterium]|nr:Hsp20/alpha crystallin family protein [Gemmataceae bacterium]MDW8263831.1 Hsp20/alpha crystallin family protein [Gemmataceae bacterium]
MAADVIRRMQSLFQPPAYSSTDWVWHPSVDVYRTRDGWLVKYDLAGVRPEDIEVSAVGSRLTVRGVRRDWGVEEECCCWLMEIAYSRFERTLELPGDLERSRLVVEHRDGMLLIRIRKEERA